MIPKTKQTRHPTRLACIVLIPGLALFAAVLVSQAANLSAFISCQLGPGDICSTSSSYQLSGQLSGSISGILEDEEYEILGARLATNGPVAYADMKMIEAEAYQLLDHNKTFRQDISPHQEATQFEDLVRYFDYNQAFEVETADGLTIQKHLNLADKELRQARDLYAYLAVYADEERFRTDPDYADAGLCGVEDPFNDLIDRCNFAARMRESLREVAYLRMIFGQQFTADALGFTFGANVVGGEALVRQEVTQLEMAVEQYRLAKGAVAEGLDHYLGMGCYVSDFYTQDEWLLLSRAVEGLERASHHIAVRKSYLAPSASGLPDAQEQAEADYRTAAIDQYLDLAFMADQSTGSSQCVRGTRPDSDLVAKMVADLLSTRESLMEMKEGRNIFGFDVSFTPARPYLTAYGSEVMGLYDQAQAEAQLAKLIQDDSVASERYFDVQANKLMEEIAEVKLRYDLQLGSYTGCSSSAGDDLFFDCVESRASLLQACDVTVEDQAVFDACISRVGSGGMLREAWENVRTAYLELQRAQKGLENLSERETIETERLATVNDAILTNGEDQALMEFLATLMDSLVVEANIGPEAVAKGVDVSYNPLQPYIAEFRAGQILRQATADMEIENANSEAVVRNLLLDLVEYQIEMEIAAEKVNAQITVFNNLASGTQDLAVEARRVRAYLLSSPANDPSYRLIRDSLRLELADQLSLAARISYLAAKRAEYEYATRLGASLFPMSDIYQARTATDILTFLSGLNNVYSNLVVPITEIDQEEFRLSIRRHVLGYDEDQFHAWVEQNTVTDSLGNEILSFSFSTTPADNGVFSNAIPLVYPYFWLHKVSGVDNPEIYYNGFGMNLLTEQSDPLSYRRVTVSQSGVLHLKARSGCIFEYQMVHPAALLGLEWPEGQPSDVANSTFRASINDNTSGTRTSAFLGRPVSATNWEILVFAGSPDGGLPAMDLAQLEDIELIFDSYHATRAATLPDPEDCVRIDY
jgi:hypothetical protein